MIRKATGQDIEKIMHIWLEVSKKSHSFIAEDYWDKKYCEVRDFYLPQAETFVFEDKHQIKGFICLILDNFVGALFVHEAFQNRNIGSKLLDYVRQNRSSLTLRVYAKNMNAVKFYRKNNFKIVAEKKDETTGEDEVIMSWTLGCKCNQRIKSGQ